MAFAEKIVKRPELGWNLKGFVDDRWRGGAPQEGRFRIVSDFAGFKAFLRGNVVDEVIVCLPIVPELQGEVGADRGPPARSRAFW